MGKRLNQAQLVIGTEEPLELPIDDLLSRLNTSQSGLSSEEVKRPIFSR